MADRLVSREGDRSVGRRGWVTSGAQRWVAHHPIRRGYLPARFDGLPSKQVLVAGVGRHCAYRPWHTYTAVGYLGCLPGLAFRLARVGTALTDQPRKPAAMHPAKGGSWRDAIAATQRCPAHLWRGSHVPPFP